MYDSHHLAEGLINSAYHHDSLRAAVVKEAREMRASSIAGGDEQTVRPAAFGIRPPRGVGEIREEQPHGGPAVSHEITRRRRDKGLKERGRGLDLVQGQVHPTGG